MYKNLFLGLTILAGILISLPCFSGEPDIYDSFTRDDSNVIGKTEKGGYSWVEVNDNNGDNLISIASNQLLFYFFASEPNRSSLAANIEEYRRANIDISVNARPHSGNGGCYGISYRLDEIDGELNSHGYYVWLNTRDTPNMLYLYYADKVIASCEISIPDPVNNGVTIRVVANGASHKIYLNGSLSLDVIDYNKLKDGYVGLFSYYCVLSFADFEASVLENDIYDNFQRENSNSVGKTMTGAYTWVEVNDNANDNLISISDAQLLFHYYISSPSHSSLACNIGEYQKQDIDISVFAQPYPGYGSCYGLSYRLDDVNGGFDSPGYHVRLNSKYAPNTVSLYYRDILIATQEISIPDPSLYGVIIRAVVDGPRHQIYLNGTLSLDVVDYTQLRSGYIGLFSWYTVVHYNDFKVNIINQDLYDDFARPNSSNIGNLKRGNIPWVEVNDNANDDLISISGTQLMFHYYISSPSHSSLACNIGEYQKQDIDISVFARPYPGDGGCYGLSYRLADVNGGFDWPGYHVRLNSKYAPNTVSLYYGDILIATKEIDIPDDGVNVRVVANGPSHKIYLAELLCLDITDYNKIKEGCVGLFSWYTVVNFRNFCVTEIFPLTEYDIYDGFKRGNTKAIGNTALGKYPWVEVGDNDIGNLISISNTQLMFHYYISSPSHSSLACNIGEYQKQDIDISVFARPYPGDGGCYGLSYRLADVNGGFDWPGYHVRLNSKYAPNTVSLYYGDILIATKEIDIPDDGVNVRVVANGPSHKIYLDELLCLDVTDYNKIKEGYVGLFSWYSVVHFKDFFVKESKTLYPRGNLFPFGVYGVITAEGAKAFWRDGFTLMKVGRYYSPDRSEEEVAAVFKEMMDTAKEKNIPVMFTLGGAKLIHRGIDPNYPFDITQPQYAEIMQEFIDLFNEWKNYENIAYWNLPEEQRWRYDGERGEQLAFSDYLRQNDPDNRPSIHYTCGSWDQVGVEPWIPSIDIIGRGCYPDYAQKPRALVYWTIGIGVNSIYSQGYTLNNRIVAAYLQLSTENSLHLTTPTDAYHDVFASIVAGAKFLIESNNESQGELPGVYESYSKAAKQITREVGLGEVILFGEEVNIDWDILSGPEMTEWFQPVYYWPNVQYPSLNVFSKEYNGKYFIIAVNSSYESLQVKFTVTKSYNNSVLVPFEGRKNPISNNQFEDRFEPLAVHIYMP